MTGIHGWNRSQLADLLTVSAAEYPEHGVGFVRPDLSVRFLTYPQLLDHALRLLKGLQSLGVQKGDIAILSLDSNAEIIPVLWACFIGGIVPALLQPPVSFSEYNPAAEKAGKVYRLLGNPFVILSHRHLESWISGGIPSAALIDIAEISTGDPDPEVPVNSSDDLALLQFSSGSTGDPKGVSLTHHNILHNISDIIAGLELKSYENSVSWMPLYHDMGLIGFHLTPVCTGTTAFYIEPVDFIKNPLLWLGTMSQKKSVITGCPNFGQIIVNRAISRKKNPSWDLSGIRVVFNGAEPISVPTMNEFNANLTSFGYNPAAMLPCYGMAEATLAVSFTPLGSEPAVHSFRRSALFGRGVAEETDGGEDSVQLVDLGKNLSYCEIRIAGEDGNPLPPGHTGHVHVRGENITSGYFNNPEATASAIRDGWLHTGDLGFIHDGALFIMGRLKDIIFINGINYYAHDLEAIALRAEGISWGRIVMAGYFDEKEGKDKVLVFMVTPGNESSLDLFRSLQRHFLKTIGLLIDTFIPVKSNDIPRTSSGKVQRYKMVNRFLQGEFQVVRL
jgi:acyl-CoA synthetase (AMP-forming)/AMP-acid ligase II